MSRLKLPAALALLLVCAAHFSSAQSAPVTFISSNPSLLNGSDGNLAVNLQITNSGTVVAGDVQITSIDLASGKRVAPATLPAAGGDVAAGGSIPIAAKFSAGSLNIGGRYLFDIQGTYLEDGVRHGFAVNRYIDVPALAATAVKVRAFHRDPAAAGEKGAPLGAGVVVRLNDVVAGVSGADGTLTVAAAPGGLTIDARNYPEEAGLATATAIAGATVEADVLLDEGSELAEPTRLTLDEAPRGLVPQDFTTFTLRFLDGAVTVPFKTLDLVSVEYLSGDRPTQITDNFTVREDGAIVCTDPATVADLVGSHNGGIQINAAGYDQQGHVHEGSAAIRVARYQVAGVLTAPPSKPDLKVGNVFVVADVLESKISLQTITDAFGNFSFPRLPAGNVYFHAEVVQDGLYYNGDLTQALSSDTPLSVVLNGVQDLGTTTTSSVSPKPKFASLAQKKRVHRHRRQLQKAYLRSLKGRQPFIVKAENDVTLGSVSTTSTDQDIDVKQAIRVTVPQGTSQLRLRYQITSVEYPDFVLTNSVFNDRWSLDVREVSGKKLFPGLHLQVNSQLTQPPQWIVGTSPGMTQVVNKTIDVSALTQTSSAQVVLAASATNIGDSQLPTTVDASLVLVPAPSIDVISRDVAPADTDYFSIPRQGEINGIPRFFTLRITKPPGGILTNVQARLLDGSGNLLLPLVDQSPDGNVVTEIDDHTIRVQVTPRLASALATEPPPTNQIAYEFAFTVSSSQGVLTSASEKSDIYKALWRRPAHVEYPKVNGDWVTQGAYNFITNYSDQLTALNDSSAEHGIYLYPHSGHREGHSLDMFHFYPAYVSGLRATDAWHQIEAAIGDAVSGSATADDSQKQVSTWVSETRAGLDALADAPELKLVYYVDDPEGSKLLKDGSVTINGVLLDTGLGAWTTGGLKLYTPYPGHNTHLHLELDAKNLNEQ